MENQGKKTELLNASCKNRKTDWEDKQVVQMRSLFFVYTRKFIRWQNRLRHFLITEGGMGYEREAYPYGSAQGSDPWSTGKLRGNPELTKFLGEQCVGVDVNSMKPLIMRTAGHGGWQDRPALPEMWSEIIISPGRSLRERGCCLEIWRSTPLVRKIPITECFSRRSGCTGKMEPAKNSCILDMKILRRGWGESDWRSKGSVLTWANKETTKSVEAEVVVSFIL